MNYRFPEVAKDEEVVVIQFLISIESLTVLLCPFLAPFKTLELTPNAKLISCHL